MNNALEVLKRELAQVQAQKEDAANAVAEYEHRWDKKD